jgi:hypothetical protein
VIKVIASLLGKEFLYSRIKMRRKGGGRNISYSLFM